ncbi:DNA repair protein RAD57 [Candida viswanathii]|uniref:DNA repair protein RAD57 n=1 Tax=Candida viswanathii TaxID=5486 RepID=A0A367YN70_9ASCO|nr:DNA repair protein RAD57 [Candida viswanathii]
MDDYKQLGPGKFSCSTKFTFLTSVLQSHGKSVNDLLQYHEASDHVQLSRLVNRPLKEVDDYYKVLEQDLEVAPSSIESLLQSDFITTGLPSIDNELGGGIPIGEVTEIFGASGCGKSHFLFQLLANCRSQYDTSDNIHISTESFLETKRLKDIIGAQRKSDMDLISYIYCQDLESQDHILYTQLPLKLQQNQGRTKLVVIDSIAQHFRREDSIMNSTYLKQKIETQEAALEEDKSFEEIRRQQKSNLKKFNKSPKYASRTGKLYYVCLLFQHLSRLAQEFHIAVVVINQVSDLPLRSDQGFIDAFEEELEYPLNLDFQTAVSSGWDGTSMYRVFPNTNLNLNHSDLESLDIELMRSFDRSNMGSAESSNKRQKVTSAGENGLSLTSTTSSTSSDIYEVQKDLIYRSHELRNRGTKRIVPTLGYPWASRIKNKIMLMKTYKPILKSESELSEEVAEHAILREKTPDVPNANGKRARNDPVDQSNSLIKGWQVERFAKVVSSTNNHNSNRFRKYQFVINKQGLVEVNIE